MAKFLPSGEFANKSGDELQLLPMRFERVAPGRIFAANIVGDILPLTNDELDRIVTRNVTPGDGLYERAFSKLLIARKGQRSQLQLLALRLRSRMSFLKAYHPAPIYSS